ADSGFFPFSGTSSATPAMAGFAARILSQARADGLKVDRDVLRTAVIESAVQQLDVPFIDQGYGIPNLLRAYDLYKEKIAQAKLLPRLAVGGRKTGQGITRRGVYVRGMTNREDVYGFDVTPAFTDAWNDQDKANYAEHLVLTTDADWIAMPRDAFVSSS